MIKVYKTLSEARAARKELPNKVNGFLTGNYIRKTIDGKYAVISVPSDSYLSQETIARYNLPAGTLGWFDEGEPKE